MLAPGTYLLALSKGHSDPAPVEDPVVVSGPTSMQGTHTSYKALRTAGTVVGVGSAIAGIIVIGLGLVRQKDSCDAAGNNCQSQADPDWTKVGVGVGVIVVGAILGAVMNKSDTASVRVVPFMTPESIRPVRSASTSVGADSLSSRTPGWQPGLGLACTF
jgi:hypothetical protein